MATHSTPQSAQAPPTIPSDPSISVALTNYLNRLTLWCRNGFADKIKNNTAGPGILVQATDAATGAATPFVYLVGVKVTVTGGVASSPTVTFTAQPLGSGKP